MKEEIDIKRDQQADYLKKELAMLLNDKPESHLRGQIVTCHVDKELFIEMAFCFIAKHGK